MACTSGRATPPRQTRALKLGRNNMRCRELDQARPLPETARLSIAEQKIIGWYQGRMEWGPRALGNRSILADPRNPAMKDILNDRVKHREDFRPFAPAILEEHMAEFMELDCPSPYMLLIASVRQEKQAVIPAVTHVDGTARPQVPQQPPERSLLRPHQ